MHHNPFTVLARFLSADWLMPDAEDLLGRFEDAWQRGETPPLDAFAPAADPDTLCALVQIDLEYRWAPLTGKPPAERWELEDYLARFPSLAGAEHLDELIAAEYRVRSWAGESPTAAEFAERFEIPEETVATKLAAAEIETSVPTAVSSASDVGGPALPAFIAALAATGVLTASECPAAGSAKELARKLVDLGRLTRFQADALLRGRGGDLRIGPYRLYDRLGEGVSGRVYRAIRDETGETVALKVFRDDLLGELDEAGIARFHREVEAAGRLEHPHVVRSRGAGTVDGVNFLAMEFLDGTDLGRMVVSSGPLPAGQACEYVRQAALALQHLADRGMVHRDVKPSNLFVTGADPTSGDWGTLKLLDVGLALLATDPGRSESPLTRTGDFLGTPDFMAPEQAIDPHAADVRSDLYGLGCTWYFLLTGRPPFVGGSFVRKIDRHRCEPPRPVDAIRPDVGPEMAAAIHRLLAKKPAERFAVPSDIAALIADLQARDAQGTGSDAPILRLVVDGTRTTPPANKLGRRAILAAAIVLPAAAIAVERWFRSPPVTTPPVDPADAELQALEARERDAVGTDREVLAGDVRAFRARFPGTVQAERAAGLLMRLPSPLDVLPAGPLPSAELLAGVRDDLPEIPAGLVAVVGKPGPKHWSAVTGLALDRAGTTLTSAGYDGTLRLWDAQSGNALRTLLGHTQPVTRVAFRPDGKRLASAGNEGTVRIWDVESGRCLRTLTPAKTGRVVAIAFSPDGGSVVSAGAYPGYAVKLWDAETGHEKRELRGPTGLVEAVAFLPNGSAVLAAGVDGNVRSWDVATGEPRSEIDTDSAVVHALAVRGDGAIAIGTDNALALWLDGKKQWAIPQPAAVRAIAFSADGNTLAWATNREPTIQLCDADGGKNRRALRGHADIVTGLAFSPDGGTLFSSNRDGSLKWWDAVALKERGDRPKQRADVDMVEFRDDGEVLLAAAKDGTVKFWETRRAADLRSLLSLPGMTRSVAMARDGRILATGGWDGRVKIWEVATGRRLFDFPAHTGWVIRLALSPDGRTLASTGLSDAPSVKLWDVAAGQPIREFATELPAGQFFRDVAFDGNGRAVAALTSRATVHLWDAATGEAWPTYSGRRADNLCSFALKPAGGVGAFGSADGTLALWDTTSAAEIRTIPAHDGAVYAVAFRPDGRAVATAGSDGFVRIWSTDTGQRLRESRVGPRLGRVHQIAFAPDGRHLSTANGNGTAYVLRLPAE